MVQVLNIRVDGADGLVGADVPFYIYGDPDHGPTVSLMAGVHGCEYTSMLGLRRFLAGLDETALRGSLRVVPIANIAAFHARAAFVVPHDGLNLNRCFPGDPKGSFSQRLAYALFENVILPAEYHIDLHAGDQVEDLEPFTIYDVSDVEEQSRAMAYSYGLGYVVRSGPSASPIAGTSSAAAAEVGIASFTAEVGGRGLVDEISVRLHEEGIVRVLSMLGVLPNSLPPAPAPVELDHWVWPRATEAGWWTPHVCAGDHVLAGTVIGTVSALDGSAVEEIIVPESGVLLFLTTSPAVAKDGLLLGLGVQ
jgi:predicted deacylase